METKEFGVIKESLLTDLRQDIMETEEKQNL